MESRLVPAAERRLSILAVAGGVMAVVLLAFAPPAAYPIPDCPFHAVTGAYCPGCGTLRASHSLLGGHFLHAVGYNALFVLLLPLLAWWGLGWTRAAFFGRNWTSVVTPRFGWVLLAAVVGWWLVRNLPWAVFEALRPVVGNPLLG